MFAKLVVVVLTIGVCACTLLSLRQARLQAAHELTRAQLRVRESDDRLWAMRADIARRVVPDQVQQMASALGRFRPMLPLPQDFERRAAYARLAEPRVSPVPPEPARAARAEVRTVSNRHPSPSPVTPVTPARPSKPRKDAAATPAGQRRPAGAGRGERSP